MKNRHKQQILSSLLSLTLIACQVPPPSGPQTQKVNPNQTPVLLAPKGPDMPQKLKALVEQKGGNPSFVKVVPIQEMKDLFSKPQKPNAKRVERPLQKHFSLAQTGQESCDWSSMNICGYQEVGNWQEYYDAIYNDFASFYNGLCAYETKDYCVYDEGQACHLQTREMQFYGCSCRDGYEKTAEGCTRPLALKVKYTRPGSTTPDEGELMISPLQPNHPNNEIEIEVHDDGKHYWQMDIFNANGEQVFHRGGDPFAQEKVFKWSGTVYGNDSEYLPNGVYTIQLSSNGQTVERNVRIENSLLFLVNYDVAADALPPPQEILPFRPAQAGEPTAIRIQVFQQPGIPWELKYINAQGQVLESLSVESTPEINIRFWEGKDPQTGEYLPNGLYTIELVSNGETRVQKVLIDHQLKLTIRGLSRIGEEPMTENIEIAPGAQPGPSVYNEIDLQVEPKGSLPWQLRILNAAQQSVYEYEDNSFKNLRWEGRDPNSNTFLPNGLYTVIATSDGESKSQTFRINNQMRLRIQDNTLPPTFIPENVVPVIYPFSEGQASYFNLYVDTVDTLPWNLAVYRSNGEKIREWLSNNTSQITWGGEDFQGKLLPSGDYTFVLKSGLDEVRRTVRVDSAPSLQVLFGSVSGNGAGYIPPEGEVFLTPGKQDGIIDHARLLVGASEEDHWLLEVKDYSNSTVWYERGSGSKEIHWRGTNQNNKMVAEGRYTVRLTSGTTQRSQTLRVDDLANPKLKLYFDEYLQKLLDSIEPRLAVTRRDTEMLYERTRAAIPNVPAFQLQSLPDIAAFRIQQQQVDPEPTEDLSHYPLAEKTDALKTNTDVQNDRILTEVHKIRQKLTWIRSVNNTFRTQQSSGGEAEAKGRSEEAKQLEKTLYGLDTASGCYNYYRLKSQWKRPLKAPTPPDPQCEDNDNDPNTVCPGTGGNGGGGKEDEAETSISLLSVTEELDGSLSLFGRVNDPPENFDYQLLAPDFGGDIELLSPVQITADATGYFKIVIKNFRVTDQYVNKTPSELLVEGPFFEAKVKLFSLIGFQTTQIGPYPGENVPPSQKINIQSLEQVPPGAHLLNFPVMYSKKFGGTKHPNDAIIKASRAIKKKYGKYFLNYFTKINYSHNAYNIPDLYKSDLSKLPGFYCQIKYDAATNGYGKMGRRLNIDIGNLAYRNWISLKTTIVHELFHRSEYLRGKQFDKTFYSLEESAYNFTLNTLTGKDVDEQEITENKTMLTEVKKRKLPGINVSDDSFDHIWPIEDIYKQDYVDARQFLLIPSCDI